MTQWQMHRIGHERDPHPPLTGVANFTPPILGRVKVANFTITTGLGTGTWLIGAGILLEIGAGLLSRQPIGRAAAKTALAQVRPPSVMAT